MGACGPAPALSSDQFAAGSTRDSRGFSLTGVIPFDENRLGRGSERVIATRYVEQAFGGLAASRTARRTARSGELPPDSGSPRRLSEYGRPTSTTSEVAHTPPSFSGDGLLRSSRRSSE